MRACSKFLLSVIVGTASSVLPVVLLLRAMVYNDFPREVVVFFCIHSFIVAFLASTAMVVNKHQLNQLGWFALTGGVISTFVIFIMGVVTIFFNQRSVPPFDAWVVLCSSGALLGIAIGAGASVPAKLFKLFEKI